MEDIYLFQMASRHQTFAKECLELLVIDHSCLAEFPGVLENLFAEKVYSYRGKYSIKLLTQPSTTLRGYRRSFSMHEERCT